MSDANFNYNGINVTFSSDIMPFSDYVAVIPLQNGIKPVKGFQIPKTVSTQKSQDGIVIAFGEDVLGKIEMGQHVVFDRYVGSDIRLKVIEDGNEKDIEVRVLHFGQLLGRIIPHQTHEQA